MGAVLAFAGRLLLASLFLLSGAMKIGQHDEGPQGPIVAYMTPKMDTALAKFEKYTGLHVPIEQDTYSMLVLVAGVFELLGGVMFTLNFRFGAFILMVFLVPTSFVMHNFWDLEPNSPGHQIEFINFMKNLCLFGAFLTFINMPRHVVAPKMKTL